MTTHSPDAVADMFKVLAHPLRVALVLALRDGPQSVSTLQDMLQVTQSAVSAQLLRMRNDGVVTCLRSDADARIMVYALADRRVLSLVDLARLT